MSLEALSAAKSDKDRANPTSSLTSAQKAAVIISALPAEESSTLLNQLGPAHIRAFVRATTELKNVPAATLERIILEFLETLDHRQVAVGPDVAREILSRIMSADAVADVIDGVVGRKRSNWEEIANCDEAAIAKFVSGEHPRTMSIILGKLAPEKAAAVLDRLPPDVAEQTVSRLQKDANVPAHIVERIGETMYQELAAKESSKAKPDVIVGAIFDSLTDQKRDPLLKSLEARDPAFAKAVQRHMFLFDDIAHRVEPRDIPSVTRSSNQGSLKTALSYGRGRGSAGADFILSNMSRRLAEQLEEELEEMPPVSMKDGELAEAEIIRTIRSLAEDGEIALIEQAEDEDEAA